MSVLSEYLNLARHCHTQSYTLFSTFRYFEPLCFATLHFVQQLTCSNVFKCLQCVGQSFWIGIHITHLPLVSHICVRGLCQHWFRPGPVVCSAQAIIWTNAGIVLTGLLRTHFNTHTREWVIKFNGLFRTKKHKKWGRPFKLIHHWRMWP